MVLKVEKSNLGGQGIAYLNGKVCFVDFVIPEEEIKAEIIVEKKDYNIARVVDIIKPSPARVTPLCPVFGRCGGCQMQHIDYSKQIELKREILIDTLKHIGKIDFHDIEVFYEEPWYYRNRAQLPAQKDGEFKLGYFKKGTHEVVNHEVCYINQREINCITEILRERIKKSNIEIYDELKHRGNLRHLIIKRGTNTGQVYITFVTKERSLPEVTYEGLMQEIPQITGINQNINVQKTNRILGSKNIILAGRNYYEERIADKKFRIGPMSFFQVNTSVFEKIVEKIKQEIQGSKIIDLYSGVGAIGICVAPLCKRVTAIEENPDAIKDGIENAKLNNIKNIDFIEDKVEKRILEIKDADTVVLDPPRKGVARLVIERLKRIRVKKIIYLSCHPATLARDANLIIGGGYQIKKVYLFDMFPQTYHIESLMIFEKGDAYLF